MAELIYYTYTNNPACRKVEKYLKGKGIEVETRNTFNPPIAYELTHTAGQRKVPCLMVDGSPVFGADDIIAYFEEHDG